MLCRTARASIEELKALGVADLDADEITTLNDLARAVERMADRLAGGSGDHPASVCVAGVVLRAPTCAAEDWMGVVEPVARRAGLSMQCYAYALAHGRDPAALDHASPAQAIADVRRWWRKLPATAAEIDAAIDALAAFGEASGADAARHALEAIRSRLHGVQDAAPVLEALETLLKLPKAEADAQTNRPAWRDICLRVSAFGCGNPDDWYWRSRDEAVRAFSYAVEAAAMRAGAGQDAATTAPVQEIRALRAEMARIVEARKR